jgi:hypothetical protein
VPVDHRHVGPFPLVRSDLGEAAYRRSLAVVMDNIVHRRRPGNSSIRALSALGSTLTANDGRLTLSAAADDRKFERFPYRIVQVHIAKTARTALGDAFRAA